MALARDLDYFERNFCFLPAHVQNAVRDQLLRLKGGDPDQEACQHFLPFVRRVWP